MGRNIRKENLKWHQCKKKPTDKSNFRTLNESNGCTVQMLPLGGGISIICLSLELIFDLYKEESEIFIKPSLELFGG